MLQELGFNGYQVALHHLEFYRSPILRLIRPRQWYDEHYDELIARRPIPQLASGHGEKARGTSKTEEIFAGSGQALTA